MDSVHYALALEHYDITVHQPHPPGYFLYVMLGRLFHLLISDANAALVTMSIVFNGLTVVVIYLVANEIFERRTAVIAALLAITSPNLWFHGEIALSYGVEVFFSAFVGFLCWKLYTERYQYIWLTVLALGIAGGIRQNTIVFLFPLWLLAVRKAPPWKIIASIALLGGVCISWFVPMVWMTGGWNAYTGAFKELWEFTTGHNSVFDRGWQAFSLYAQTLFDFSMFSIGAGVLTVGLSSYAFLRQGASRPTDGARPLFFAAWVLPSFLFYLTIFIHPSNPGYALIYTPPLLLISARATLNICSELEGLSGRNITLSLTSILLLINTGFFLFSTYPISWQTIKKHDESIESIRKNMRIFDPMTTVLFVRPYIFNGFRQVMYYLPQYRVYQIDIVSSPNGKKRNIFWGLNRNTFLSKKIELPAHISSIATLLAGEDRELANNTVGIIVKPVLSNISIAYGPIVQMLGIFPDKTVTISRLSN